MTVEAVVGPVTEDLKKEASDSGEVGLTGGRGTRWVIFKKNS